MKKGIKTKTGEGSSPAPETQQFPGTSAKDMKAEALRRKAILRGQQNPQNTDLPVVGNLDEYSKLAKTTTETLTASRVESSESEDEDEGDELWGTIMGKK